MDNRERHNMTAAPTPHTRWSRVAPSWYGLAAILVLVAGGIGAERVRHRVIKSRGKLMDGRSVVSLADNHLIGDEQLPSEDRTALADALRTGKLSTPSAKTPLALATNGAQQIPGFRVLAPLGGTLISDQPHFLWEPVANAEEYRVTLFDSANHQVDESPALSDTGWLPSEPLERGMVYHWRAVARVDDRIVVATPPDAHFSIASEDVAQKVILAQQKYPDHHLLLAVLEARAGDVAQARHELHQAQEQSGDLPLLERLQDSLTEDDATAPGH